MLLTLISEVRLDEEEEEAAPLSLTVDPAAAVATISGVASPLPPWLLLLLCRLAVAFINLVIILLTAFELLFVSRYSSDMLGSWNRDMSKRTLF